ncbi:MAG TPA: hypothetical protein ENJ55_04060 [Rhizobiales bacterium]|nr:hypothetical protein [Hyphomicrobiales bacterium]
MEEKPDIGHTSWYENLSVTRWIFAIFGILIMLFAGGCSLVALPGLLQDPGGITNLALIAVFGGIPFGVGLLTWWLAAKVGRNRSAQ